MSGQILHSESFDRAASNLSGAMNSFSTGGFEEAVRQFERSVDRMARILGMQAANSQSPENQPYSEHDFFNA